VNLCILILIIILDKAFISKELYNYRMNSKKLLKIEPWKEYNNTFELNGIKLPYIPIVGLGGVSQKKFRRSDVTSKTIIEDYSADQEFYDNPTVYKYIISDNYTREPKCRLVDFDVFKTDMSTSDLLTLTFSQITYLDYLLTGQHIDDLIQGTNGLTYRSKYVSNVDLFNVSKSKVSNICGVGLFILTADNKLLITKRSEKVIVSPNALSYTASGTMDWSENVHPFSEISRECFEEIGHQIEEDKLILFAFGLETRKLYYQLSFLECSSLSSEEIIQNAHLAEDFNNEVSEIFAVPFSLDNLGELLSENANWDSASLYSLITICTEKFGIDYIRNIMEG